MHKGTNYAKNFAVLTNGVRGRSEFLKTKKALAPKIIDSSAGMYNVKQMSRKAFHFVDDLPNYPFLRSVW